MTDQITQAAERIERTLNGHLSKGAAGAAQLAHLIALLAERVATLEDRADVFEDSLALLTEDVDDHELRITALENP